MLSFGIRLTMNYYYCKLINSVVTMYSKGPEKQISLLRHWILFLENKIYLGFVFSNWVFVIMLLGNITLCYIYISLVKFRG